MTYEIPPRQRPEDDNGYLEQMTKAIFQAGFSWRVIRDKWPNFRRAFDGFDVEKVAGYDERDVERLLADEGIVRNGRKIEATIQTSITGQRFLSSHLGTSSSTQYRKTKRPVGPRCLKRRRSSLRRPA